VVQKGQNQNWAKLKTCPLLKTRLLPVPTLAKGVLPKAFPNHQKGIIEGTP